nr:MAG TPA: putative ABC-transporter type IV [Caudoviricetes sp.]
MKVQSKTFLHTLILLIIGGCIYMGVELLYRGYTHWTMGIVGGLCFVAVGLLNEELPWHMCFETQMLYGGAMITCVEFVAGCVLNLWLHLNIWNYNQLPGNILGQVCPQFAAIWVALSAAIIPLDDWLREKLFGEPRQKYCWGLSHLIQRRHK